MAWTIRDIVLPLFRKDILRDANAAEIRKAEVAVKDPANSSHHGADDLVSRFWRELCKNDSDGRTGDMPSDYVGVTDRLINSRNKLRNSFVFTGVANQPGHVENHQQEEPVRSLGPLPFEADRGVEGVLL